MIHLEAFLQSKRSERTRMHYRTILYSYFDYCKARNVEIMSADSVVDYVHNLKGLSQGTIDNRIACLKSYFAFLSDLDVKPIVKLKNRLPRGNSDSCRPTNGLSDEEVRAIVDSIDLNTACGIMHVCLIKLILFTGIRISEVQGLKDSDIIKDGKRLTIRVLGKGNKYRVIPLQDSIAELVSKYLASRVYTVTSVTAQPSADSRLQVPLFSIDGINPLHKNTIRNILKKYCDIAGITKKISPHSLRVTCVSNMLENNANPIYVQYMGGWTNMNMVLKYDRRRQEIKNSAAFLVNYGVRK